MNWYYHDGKQQVGPIAEAQLIELRRSGAITADTMVWREGMANWARYQEVGPAVDLGTAPPPATPAPPMIQSNSQDAACVECGKVFPKAQMIPHGAAHVCAGCKPLFMQKLAEGARIGIPGRTAPARFAGFWIRFCARFIDGIIMSILLYVPMFIIILASGHSIERTLGNNQEFGMMQLLVLCWELIWFVIYGGYEIFFIGKYGATPGKMALRLRVVTAEGQPVQYGRATGRFFANMLSGMICYIGYIIAGFDDQKRALHDHICNTRVVFKD
ncbi:MAG: hypothetical protein RLY20_2780 [Verrucomicrobiota bacterium]|jgi:uncharacterized RDD family membrane protein YckC